MRVVLASPTYGPVDAEHRDYLLAAVMYAAKHGVTWEGNASSRRRSWEEARNGPVSEVLAAGGVDGIVWVDSDMKLAPEAITRLLAHDKDLISGLYFQRVPPYWPNAYSWNPKTKKFNRLYDYRPNTVFEIGGFGFGICYTSTRLLAKLPPNPFKFGEFSEDLTFCKLAAEAGFQAWINTGVIAEHDAGPRWIGEDHYNRWKASIVKREEGRSNGSCVPAVGR